MNYIYRCSAKSFPTLCVAFLAMILFHAEPAFAKGGETNPVQIIGMVTVDDGGGSLTVDDGGISLTVDGAVDVTDGGGSLTVDTGGGSLDVDILSQPALTHMGQFPVDHVTLVGANDATCTGASEATATLSPSGAFGSVPFTVPSGRVLVITDISATVTENVAFVEGAFAILGLRIAAPERTIFTKAVEISAAVALEGVVAIDGHSISGALIGENKVPCVLGQSTAGGATVSNIILHGYLIDE